MSMIESPITVEHLSVEKLQPDPLNPRRIDDTGLEALTRSEYRIHALIGAICRGRG